MRPVQRDFQNIVEAEWILKREVGIWVRKVRLGYRQSKRYEGRKKRFFKTLEKSNGN